MLELQANDFIDELLDDKLGIDFEVKIENYIHRMDMYEISQVVERDIDDIDVSLVEKPLITDIYLDFEEDRVTYSIEFKVDVECDAKVFGEEHETIGSVRLELKGNLYVDRSIDYDIEDIDDLDNNVNNLIFEYVSVEDGKLIPYENLCVICGEQEGVYNYNDEGLICEECSHDRNGGYEVCTSCGRIMPWNKMSGDVVCNRCASED